MLDTGCQFSRSITGQGGVGAILIVEILEQSFRQPKSDRQLCARKQSIGEKTNAAKGSKRPITVVSQTQHSLFLKQVWLRLIELPETSRIKVLAPVFPMK